MFVVYTKDVAEGCKCYSDDAIICSKYIVIGYDFTRISFKLTKTCKIYFIDIQLYVMDAKPIFKSV